MSKITDSLIRSYNNTVVIAGNADTGAALQKAIAAATAMMYCSDERRADLYARLIEAKFCEMTGIERRITTNTVIQRWNYDHIFTVKDDGPVEPDEADKPEFAYPEPTFDETLKKWVLDTTLGETIARNHFDDEPTAEEIAAYRSEHEKRLLAAAALASQAAQQEAQV